MKNPRLALLHMAALSIACVRGMAEFTSLQRWRLRDRMQRLSSRA